jgi:hypothetical protein
VWAGHMVGAIGCLPNAGASRTKDPHPILLSSALETPSNTSATLTTVRPMKSRLAPAERLPCSRSATPHAFRTAGKLPTIKCRCSTKRNCRSSGVAGGEVGRSAAPEIKEIALLGHRWTRVPTTPQLLRNRLDATSNTRYGAVLYSPEASGAMAADWSPAITRERRDSTLDSRRRHYQCAY